MTNFEAAKEAIDGRLKVMEERLTTLRKILEEEATSFF